MCGRYTLSATEAAIIEAFAVEDVFMETALTPRFNLAPTQQAPIVFAKDGSRVLTTYQWGLVPFFAKEAGSKAMINARAETLAEKPFFKTALNRRRCLVPADGFYEWLPAASTAKGSRKQPVWIHLKNKEPGPRLFAFAGLYDTNKNIDHAKPLNTFTIITTSANAAISPVHNRMPVILSPQAIEIWLNPTIQDPEQLLPLLNGAPDDIIEMYQVSTKVNSPSYDSSELIEKIESD